MSPDLAYVLGGVLRGALAAAAVLLPLALTVLAVTS